MLFAAVGGAFGLLGVAPTARADVAERATKISFKDKVSLPGGGQSRSGVGKKEQSGGRAGMVFCG